MAAAQERHIPLEGEPNFRDLGGYKTKDGRTVKPGIIFRSGDLPKLSDADVATLEALGIKTVVNFLTPKEIEAAGPDRLPEGVRTISLPIDAETSLDGILDDLAHARKTGDFSRIPPEINPDIHRALIRDASGQYSALIEVLADPENHPVAFHCSHGVHRTGTAAAVLLTALGVPWETAREDYLLSNDYRKAQNMKRIGQLKALAAEDQGIPVEEVDDRSIRAFYLLEPGYIDASQDEAIKLHGSMEVYLRDGLGLSEEQIARLKEALLD